MFKIWIATASLSGILLAPLSLPAQTSSGTAPSSAAQSQGSSAGMSTTPAATAQAAAPASEGGAQVQPSKVYGDMLHLFSQEIIGAAQAMPEGKYTFAPSVPGGNFTGVRTFVQQIQHLTSANYMFVKEFGVGPGVEDAKIKALTSKSDLVQALTDSFAAVQKAIDTMTPANAFTAVTTGARPQTRAGNISFCLAHSMDHYGQMVEYLRMNGVVPPASARPAAGQD